MKAIERHRQTWQGKSDEWLFERLDNELKQKVEEIHRLLAENEALRQFDVMGSCCEFATKKRGFIYVDEECGNKAKIRIKKRAMKVYKKQVWLNRKGSSSTGSVVAFDGIDKDWKGESFRNTFIQINDCSRSITLHKTENDSIPQFVQKLDKLECIIRDFKEHLKSTT